VDGEGGHHAARGVKLAGDLDLAGAFERQIERPAGLDQVGFEAAIASGVDVLVGPLADESDGGKAGGVDWVVPGRNQMGAAGSRYLGRED